MTAGRTVNSKSQSWGTPLKYVEAVKDFFGAPIDLDPCSNEYSIVNAKTEYKLPETDGLKASWDYKNIYVNPPYGADKERGSRIIDWLEKCNQANILYKSQILALVPVATNTKHWKKFVFPCASAVCFLGDTRLKFTVNGKDGGTGAPMACAMVYWGDDSSKFSHVFSSYGFVFVLKGKEVLYNGCPAGVADANS